MSIPTHLQIVRQLLKFSPRQGVNETKTADWLEQILADHAIQYHRQRFTTRLPHTKAASLKLDGQAVPCVNTGLVSGQITNRDHLVSSLISSQPLIDTPNINFNPRSPAISRSNHYFAPSVAISAADLPRLLKARDVRASVEVEPREHRSRNIIVGSSARPRNIYIAHYDSIDLGATDNASGVAVVLRLALQSTTDQDWFVFSGNEEISYDHPVYWGHGFRELVQANRPAFDATQMIWIVDCVGNAPPQTSTDPQLVKLAFPLDEPDATRLAGKIKLVFGDLDKLMRVYHSPADNIGELREKWLHAATVMIKA